ncbi:FlgD immunoglobulin-like domain containing protein [Candidatus Ruminimicrobiellum ovillum]|uniref:FlgD immunoglobulin-like domain containing protein n=1 Tax=Candidatus Ruminimicrobiellum ovillum TaxID=1947927 RepID=UPI003559C0C5
MKKKILALLSLIVLLSGSVCLYAEVLKVLGAYASFGGSVVVPTITHTAIETVSSIDKILNAKISVDFGDYTDSTATARIDYSVDGGSVEQEPPGEGITIKNNEEFFIQLPDFLESNTNVDYQIVIDFRDEQGTIIKTVTFPSGTESQHAELTDTVTKDVTASAGGVVEFNSGNQQYESSKLEIAPNALSTDAQIIIKQLPIEDYISSTEQMAALYQVYSIPDNIEILSPIKATFYYGLNPTSNNFVLKYKKQDSDKWKDITISDTDLQNKTVMSYITDLGYYGIFEKVKEEDKSYRPKKRVVVKGRDVFRFNGLQQGDSVKIYNTSGKKVKEISSGDAEGFKWDGKKDNGDYASSGIYVYQIKVKGKLISGTIAFVK